MPVKSFSLNVEYKLQKYFFHMARVESTKVNMLEDLDHFT